ncbi:MAG: 2'-5' RNA ligase family protein [Candidatus Aenigmarchaeota archaeon]|nr:2'-5' RNA ligase family protein [Candidatus Aenigmarchaeota archaeon]
MESISCNIVIQPSPEISRKAILICRELKKYGVFFTLDGEHYYPHITLYVTEFPVKNIEKIKQTLERMASETKPFKVEPEKYRQNRRGWIDVSYRRTGEVLNLHKEVIRLLNPLREGLVRQKYAEQTSKLSYNKQMNLAKYGFPLAFSLYVPHMSFTRFKDTHKRLVSMLPNQDFSFVADRIGLFRINENSGWKLLGSFRLHK